MINHKTIEKNSSLLLVLSLIVVSIGGIVEIAPTFYLENTIEKVKGVRPYSPLELMGYNIYKREGCNLCHSQMMRWSVMAIILSPLKACMTTPLCGAPNAPGQTWPGSEGAIQTNGTVSI